MPNVVTTHIMVPMRDGIHLAADLYQPDENRARPTILIRTPYDKTARGLIDIGHRWADNGYACFIQDCRGRYQSEGVFYKYVNEAEDGYDTVEWMAQQNWCDSRDRPAGHSRLDGYVPRSDYW